MAKMSWLTLALAGAFATALGVATPAAAQGRGKDHGKQYAVSSSRAVTVTRTVLERRGYDVVRIERVGATQVVYYHRGNNGRGRGRGPLQKLVIREVRNRVVFEDAAPDILVDIDIKLH